ncbi:ABC transporter G family member 32 [Acorus gramineus]|uniref:ABC transporter G family member 32 n=1 Tax=Acorus gramineus TaxID=55184 RepID=A0AAV9A546_ACOGR|nr:ABC transporter G family member 32 [Acorus gramineus]
MWGPTAEAAFSRSSSYRDGGGTEDDEEALRWAAIERLPTFSRVRRGIYRSEAGEGPEVIDVAEGLEIRERRRVVLERVVADVGDAEMFLARMRQRFDDQERSQDDAIVGSSKFWEDYFAFGSCRKAWT